MLSKRFKPVVYAARKAYVELMFQVIGRALEASSKSDEQIRREVSKLPKGLTFEMKVMPDGSGLVVRHEGDGVFRYLGGSIPGKVDLSVQFKHIQHAFMVFSFQEKTAVSFANDRILVDGEVSYAIRMVRILNRVESFILPKVIASHAVKEYPADLQLPEKLLSAARIYLKTVNLFFDREHA